MDLWIYGSLKSDDFKVKDRPEKRCALRTAPRAYTLARVHPHHRLTGSLPVAAG